jgi:drug/metabolite transporter (DMT)-like permease
MFIEIGILAALAALVFWGVGDFLIQNTTRKFGDWEMLFVITLFGAVILSPFVYADVLKLVSLGDNTFFLLIGVSTILLAAALLDFEALKQGKIAVVEPVMAFEVPVAAIMAFLVINESMQLIDIFLVSSLIAGIILISLKTHHFSRKAWIERGVLLALIGALFMGTSNFMVGFAARVTNPLMANWFIDIFVASISFFYIMQNNRLGKLANDFRSDKKIILTMCVTDNFAWISFALAATLIPVVIAVGISESYIALSALLGLIISREKLLMHQKAGLLLAIASAVALAFIYA